MSGDDFAEWPEGFYMTPSEVDEMLAPYGGDAWMFANGGEEVPDTFPAEWVSYPGGDYVS
jgi:hypothetical protein